MPLHARWAAIIDAKANPRFSFVGGWLAGPIDASPEKCAHFGNFDKALAHARKIHPVVWHDVTDQHRNGKFRSTLPFDATRWRVYDPEADWINLAFTYSPRNIGSLALVKAKMDTFVLQAAPPLDMEQAKHDNYKQIMALLARIDHQVELVYAD